MTVPPFLIFLLSYQLTQAYNEIFPYTSCIRRDLFLDMLADFYLVIRPGYALKSNDPRERQQIKLKAEEM